MQAGLFGVVGVAAVVFMGRVGRGMKAGGGKGIVALELAGTTKRADQIIKEWGDPGQKAARCSLLVDFAFIIGYGGVLTVASVATSNGLGERTWSGASEIALWLAMGALVAAALDVGENLALLAYLDESKKEDPDESKRARLIGSAKPFAVLKFGLVIVILLALAVGGVVLMARPN